jgi:hypothetical protein
VRRFSWFRLVVGALAGGISALLLSWLVAPELASFMALDQRYEGPESVTPSLLLFDVIFSFAAFVVGSLLCYAIVRTKPYWACMSVGFIGWLFYFFEAGGFAGVLSGEHPLWYELAPVHFGASLAAAWLLTRPRGEA